MEKTKNPVDVTPSVDIKQTEGGSPDLLNQLEQNDTPPPIEVVTILDISASVVVVVCGSPESLPLQVKAWTAKAPSATIIGHLTENKCLADILVDVLANDDVPDVFVLVPNGCFPMYSLCLADLIAFRVRATSDGRILHDTQLPIKIDATSALKTLETIIENAPDEHFVRAYNAIAYPDEAPDVVAPFFGNIVTYIASPNPDASKVANAIDSKKFICTTNLAFAAVKDTLAALYA